VIQEESPSVKSGEVMKMFEYSEPPPLRAGSAKWTHVRRRTHGVGVLA